MCCGDDEPIFSRAKPPIIAAALSRAHLNDARRRLVAIRAACGFKDADPASGQSDDDREKDPFIAVVKDFNYYIEQVRAAAADQINDLKERTQIRQDMQKAQEALAEMKKMVDEADAELNTAELKGKSLEKIGKLSEAFDRYKQMLDQCTTLYEEVKATTTGFTWNNPSQLKKSENYQRALKLLAARSGMVHGGVDGAEGSSAAEDPDDEEMRKYAAQNEGVTLDTAKETKEQMMLIQKQKRQVKTALERIHQSVQLVREMAIQLKTETTTQVVRLEELDEHMQFSVENLRSGNARLERLHKSMQPFNVCVNCCIFVIILAAAGFLLYRYNAFPGQE